FLRLAARNPAVGSARRELDAGRRYATRPRLAAEHPEERAHARRTARRARECRPLTREFSLAGGRVGGGRPRRAVGGSARVERSGTRATHPRSRSRDGRDALWPRARSEHPARATAYLRDARVGRRR